ncbi:heavy-metal-associated domain-containing protein [Deinococcus yavapaiensis]|uniref:Heavy-metal-associated domain-containing protein n=1 Tax=Deinococcus yavapaiensis KR-236 TaxID=694435 RepID=A0A318SAA3_9DEIO|nr:heavy-metal-associated domain-containing protein [Deinococcus yavapaiensis]PYE55318.1 hypothetical protein DES52_103151 [Deinococcus yavapaiensis KR-236]
MNSRILIGVRGMTKEAGDKIARLLEDTEGIKKAIPDEGQIEVHYDASLLTVMDILRVVRSQGFLAGML